MFGIHDLTLFIVSGLLLNMMPGPDSLLIMTRSATQGWRAGCVAAFGISSGCLVHVLAAALGLSAVLSTSAAAFTLVKWVGAAYIVYIGIGLLRSKPVVDNDHSENQALPALAYRLIFFQGFLSNILNPKVALFFLAFVPQFIAMDAPSKPLAFVILGGIFAFNGLLWCNSLAIFTAYASRRLKINRRLAHWLNRVTGGVFLVMGLRLAFTKQH